MDDPAVREWLIRHGYSPKPVDVCSLDCVMADGEPTPGHLKVWRGKEICLCLAHARVLEAGKVGGSYTGAPLPPDSVATEWPWEPAKPLRLLPV
jgi:hypothetical protein